MTVASRESLRRKYLSLGWGEIAAAGVFAAVAARTASSDEWRSSRGAVWAAVAPLLVILLQAGAYWLWARRWVSRAAMPRAAATVFGTFRVLDPLLLLAGLIGLVSWWPERPEHALLATGAWTFGVVEYVNYFAVRLAYPATQWLSRVRTMQTPQLVKDLRSAEK